MLEKEPSIISEAYDFFVKIFIPSFVATSVKIATIVRNEKMTNIKVIVSFITGVGCAYFVYPFAQSNSSPEYIPLIVGLVSISGEKIMEYLIYKLDVSGILNEIINVILNKLKK